MSLTYHNGQDMNPEPINIPLTAVRTFLRKGMAVKVILEPGDATKYVLAIIPDQGSFFVMRLRNASEGKGAWINLPGPVDSPDFREMAGENEWSQKFLRWWLEGLLT